MNRQGEYVQNLSGELMYYSFKPSALPPNPKIEYDEDMIMLLSKANLSLGKLEGISSEIPNIDLYISMYVRKEALLSSQIEGTQATLDDIFDPQIDNNVNLDVAEVLNYIMANSHALELSKTLPVSNRFIKSIHEVLLSNGRGGDKTPGEFRRSQNWIGPKGSTLKDAKYIPPNVKDMSICMNSLEKYMHEVDSIDKLVKIALIHYQFETIHPFLDGNGRIGRLLINVLLKQYKLLSQDALYISYFLKKNRIEYYDRLNEVRLKGHYEQWIKFFLKAISESANNAIDCIDSLSRLHKKNIDLINDNTSKSRPNVMRIFEHIESRPIIDIGSTASAIGKTYNTASSAIMELVDLGILVQANKQDRNRVFIYEDYLSILREGTE